MAGLNLLLPALRAQVPSVDLNRLRGQGDLDQVLPEVSALFGVPQKLEHHPEGCAGVHTFMVVDQAAGLSLNFPDRLAIQIRLAALLHDVGKALTPKELLPGHPGHEFAGVAPAATALERLGVDADTRRFVLAVVEHHMLAHKALELRPGRLVSMLERDLADLSTPEMREAFLLACTADARGRLGMSDRPYPQADLLRAAFAAISAAPTDPRPGVATQMKVSAAKRAVSEFQAQQDQVPEEGEAPSPF